MLTRSSLELPEMRPPAGVTIIVVVVSKAFKAGQDPRAKNRTLGLANSLGTSHRRILGRQKFPGSSPKARPRPLPHGGRGADGRQVQSPPHQATSYPEDAKEEK